MIRDVQHHDFAGDWLAEPVVIQPDGLERRPDATRDLIGQQEPHDGSES